MDGYEEDGGIGKPPVVTIATDAELDDSVLLRDARNFAAALRIPRGRWMDWLADSLRDSNTRLVDAYGNDAMIDLELLERDGIEWWFKEWCRRPPEGVTLRVRAESRERVRLIVTVMRMVFPKETGVWGKT